MKTNVTPIATALFLAFSLGIFLSFGIAHAADTGVTGAVVGTPGAEAKGNSIPGPQQAPGGTADKGGNPTATTPGEESKGKPKIE